MSAQWISPQAAQAAKDRKIDMRMNTEATKILTDDGKVTGIQVKSKKDGTYTIHAKAVEFMEAEAKVGRTVDIASAVAHVTAQA